MIHANLIDAVAAECADALKNFKLPTEYMREPAEENFTPINIFKQYLPADLFEQTSYYPFVMVEWMNTTDNLKSGSAAQIGLTIGTFAKEADGYIDALAILDALRTRLLSKRILAKKFVLTDEATFEVPQSQPAPFFVAYGSLTYQMHLPQFADIKPLL